MENTLSSTFNWEFKSSSASTCRSWPCYLSAQLGQSERLPLCTKLYNHGNCPLKRKYCQRGRQPTHSGLTSPEVLSSSKEYQKGDGCGLGHFEKLIWETFTFFMNPSSWISLFIAWSSCLWNSLWQGVSTSNI